MRLLIILLASNLSCLGANWYASANATAGAGTFVNPWNLYIALTNYSSVISGDTIWLQDGNYSGPGYYCSLSGVTIRAMTHGGATLQDGHRGTLLVDVNSVTNGNVLISGSEFWIETQEIIIDSEHFQLQGKSGTNWFVVRAWHSTTAASHSSNSTVRLATRILYHAGTNVLFRDLFFTSVESTNRNIGNPDYTNYVSGGIDVHGEGNRLANCMFYNCGHPAIGWWDQGQGAEVNGCIVYGTGYYNEPTAAIAGSGLYGQNASGRNVLKNNIAFRNFTIGMKFFGETGPVKDCYIIENIFFDNASNPTEVSSGSTPTSNTWIQANWMTGNPRLAYVSHTNTSQYCFSNIFVNGWFSTLEHINSVYTNNTVFMPKGVGLGASKVSYDSVDWNSNQLAITWDYNDYHLGDGSSPYNWGYDTKDIIALNALGGGVLKFTNDSGKAWQDWSGWDLHSTYSATWPTDYLLVEARQLDYDTNIQHVVVICTTGATNATLTPAGISAGETIVLRDVQDYFNPVFTRTFAGGSINLPLNLTNVSTINGTLTHFTNVHYSTMFNAFVLTKTPGAGLVSTPGPGQPAAFARRP